MKKVIFTSITLFLTILGLNAQTTYTINHDGFAFSPAELTVNTGDQVTFNVTDFHPVLEVSEATWNANGITALAGGFAFPSGAGSVTFQEAGTHFYVCTSHVVSNNMKGKIIVVIPAALHEISNTGLFSVYPVPLSGNDLMVAFKDPVQKHLELFIYDLAGNLRISSKGTTADGHYKVDCSVLPKGIFLMRLKADEVSSYTKIVKE
jgi:plastocyanin